MLRKPYPPLQTLHLKACYINSVTDVVGVRNAVCMGITTVMISDAEPEVVAAIHPNILRAALWGEDVKVAAVAALPDSIRLLYLVDITVEVAKALKVREIVIERVSPEVLAILSEKYTLTGNVGMRKAATTHDILVSLSKRAEQKGIILTTEALLEHPKLMSDNEKLCEKNTLLQIENEELWIKETTLSLENRELRERLQRYEQNDLEVDNKIERGHLMLRYNPIEEILKSATSISHNTPIERVQDFPSSQSARIMDATPEVVAAMHPLIRQVILYANTKAATVAVIPRNVYVAYLLNISVDAAKALRVENIVIDEVSPEVMAILSERYTFDDKLGERKVKNSTLRLLKELLCDDIDNNHASLTTQQPAQNDLLVEIEALRARNIELTTEVARLNERLARYETNEISNVQQTSERTYHVS